MVIKIPLINIFGWVSKETHAVLTWSHSYSEEVLSPLIVWDLSQYVQST